MDATAGKRVLIVEDNPSNQKIAERLLARLGYKSDIAENGLEAVAAVKQGQYALILMDCQMPEMDGYDATRAIRRLDSDASATPIVALTANAIAGDREKCLEAGMDDYLSKPARLTDLQSITTRRIRLPADEASGAS